MNITTPCLLNSCNDIAPGGRIFLRDPVLTMPTPKTNEFE